MRRFSVLASAAHAEVDRLLARFRSSLGPRRRERNRFGAVELPEHLESRQYLADAGLSVTYYDNADFTGPSVRRVDDNVDFEWGFGSPADGIDADTFSAIWTGQVRAPATGTFSFHADADDGVRLWVNNVKLVDTWGAQPRSVRSGSVDLAAGQEYDLRLEHLEQDGDASMRLLWSGPSTPRKPVPASALSLAAPKQLTQVRAVATSDTAISLSWDDVSDEDGYLLERSDGTGFQVIAVLRPGTRGYHARGLRASKDYDFRVTPFNDFSGSRVGRTGRARTMAKPPRGTSVDPVIAALAALPVGGPTALAAASTTPVQVNLSWTDDATDELGFRIERSVNGGAFLPVGVVGANVTTFAATGLNPNTTYTFRAQAYNNAHLSDYSNALIVTTPALAVPATPMSLTAVPNSHGQIVLTWQDVSDNELGYYVEWGINGGVFNRVASAVLPTGSQTFVAGGLLSGTSVMLPGTAYTFRVQAYNAAGTSPYATAAPATPFQECEPPSPPVLVSAVATAPNVVRLTWQDRSAAEDGFRIERSTNGGVSYSDYAVAAADTTSLDVSASTSPNTTYHYRVRAYNNAGDSARSAALSAATPPAAAPSAPTNLTASGVANGTQATLNWTDTSGDESGFEVWRSQGGSYMLVATTLPNITQYVVGGMSLSTGYTFRVLAFKTVGGLTGNSAIASTINNLQMPSSVTTPTAPSGLTVTAVTPTQIDLKWNDNASNEDGYQVEIAFDGTNFSQIAQVGPNTRRYSVSNGVAGSTSFAINPSTAYTFRVRAINNTLNSSYTANVAATTPAVAVPAAPSGLTATAASATQIDLRWNDNSSSETGVRIQRSPNGTSGWTTIATLSDLPRTNYSVTGLAPGATYYFRILAFNLAGDSAWSTPLASATTLTVTLGPSSPAPAPAPVLTVFAASATQIDLRWEDKSNNETGFAIERKAGTGPWTSIASAPSNATAHTDSGVTPSQPYWYRVRPTKLADTGTLYWSNEAPITAPQSGAPPAYGGAPWPLGARIEAEDFNVGGSGAGYSDTTTGNAGGRYRTGDVDIFRLCEDNGFAVGDTAATEWLRYTITVPPEAGVPAGGTRQYRLDARVSSAGAGGMFGGYIDEELRGTVTVPDTGAWDRFRTVSLPLLLEPGDQYVLKIQMASNGDTTKMVGRFDWFQLVRPEAIAYDASTASGALEGSEYDYTFTLSAGTLSGDWTVDWGDGSTDELKFYPPRREIELPHVYRDDGAYSVVATAVVDGKKYWSPVATQVIDNVAPTLFFSGAPEAPRGEQYSLNVWTTDPANVAEDPPDRDHIYKWLVDWGDSNGAKVAYGEGNARTVSHAYAAGGTYTVRVWGADEDGEDYVAAGTLQVTVAGVDLSLEGVPELEELRGDRYVNVNANFDEQNVNFGGLPLPDWAPDADGVHRIVSGDPDLRNAAMSFDNTAPRRWVLSYPESVAVYWQPTGSGAYVLVPSGDPSPVFTGPKTVNLKIEGLRESGDVGDVLIEAQLLPDVSAGPGGGGSVPPASTGNSDAVRLTVSGVSLEIDGDNNSGFRDPHMHYAEQHAGSNPLGSGKILYRNDNDNDSDNVKDWADGFNRTNDSPDLDGVNAQEKFVPVPLFVMSPYDLSLARFRITYSASDPNAMTSPTVAPPGTLRLWKQPGHVARNKAPAASGGHYVAPGEYSAAQLGLLDPGAGTGIHLWAEAINLTPEPSLANTADRMIEVRVDPDGPGPEGFVLSSTRYLQVKDASAVPVTVSGYKYLDANKNRTRDRGIIRGGPPTIVFVVDVSGSTKVKLRSFDEIGNVNDDGYEDSILDGELASLIDLNQFLAGQPTASDARISVVAFGTTARALDMNPAAPGFQMYCAPNANANGGTVLDVEEVLRAVKIGQKGTPGGSVGESTNFEAGLQEAKRVMDALTPAAGTGNVVFLSDGYPSPDDRPEKYQDDAVALRGRRLNADEPPQYAVNVRAFGVGAGASDFHLAKIDVRGRADIFLTRDALSDAFTGVGGDYLERGLPDWTIFIDLDGDTLLDANEPFDVTDSEGYYHIAAPELSATQSYQINEVVELNWEKWEPFAFHVRDPLNLQPEYNFGNFYNARADLDIDSNNTAPYAGPAANNSPERATEDQIEDDPDLPGKILTANTGDLDNDGVPGFADGYDFDPRVGHENDNIATNSQFVPLVFNVQQLTDPNTVFQFTYSGSNPADVVISGNPIVLSVDAYLPAAGHLRVWKGGSPAVAVSRSIQDYVAPGQTYTIGELGWTQQNGLTLYVEAVRPSEAEADRAIVVGVDVDYNGYEFQADLEDLVYVTTTNHAPQFTNVPATREVHVNPYGDAPPLRGPTAWKPGDLFLSAGRGKILWFGADGTAHEPLQVPRELEPNEFEEVGGILFDEEGNLYATIASLNPEKSELAKFGPDGAFIGYLPGMNQAFRDERGLVYPETTVRDGLGNMFVGYDTGTYHPFTGYPLYRGGVTKFDADGNEVRSYLSEYDKLDHIDLAADQHTLYYTNELWWLPEGAPPYEYNAARKIKKVDLNTGEIGDFLAAPQLGEEDALAAFRVLPDGGVVVATHTRILRRFSAEGALVQTYMAPYADGIEGKHRSFDPNTYFALNLDPDGRSFWTCDYASGILARFDLDTGRLLRTFDAGELPFDGEDPPNPLGSFATLAVFNEQTAATRADQEFTFTAQGADPDEDSIVYELDPATPSHGASIDPGTGVFRWTPREPGTYTFTLLIKDAPHGLYGTPQTLTVIVDHNVDGINQDPVIRTRGLSKAKVGWQYTNRIHATDGNNDRLHYALVNTPGMLIDPDSGILSWEPGEADAANGQKTVTVWVTDPRGGFAKETYVIDIIPPDNANQHAPVFLPLAPTYSATSGTAFKLTLEMEDADDFPMDRLRLLPTDLPAGMRLGTPWMKWENHWVADLTWTPTADQVGPNEVVIGVADDRGKAGEARFMVEVAKGKIVIRGVEVLDYGPGSKQLTAIPDSNDAFFRAAYTWQLTKKPDGVPTDPLVSPVPRSQAIKVVTFPAAGSYEYTVYATDAAGESNRFPITVFVNAAAVPGDPVIGEPVPFRAVIRRDMGQQTLVTFTSTAPNNPTYTARIYWGDETHTDVAVGQPVNGKYQVVGSHRYTELGTPKGYVEIYRAEGGPSPQLRARIPLHATVVEQTLPAPTRVEAIGIGQSQIYITWDAVPGADGYVIRRTGPDGASLEIPAANLPLNKISATWYADQNLPEGTRYGYEVMAANEYRTLSAPAPIQYASTWLPAAQPTSFQRVGSDFPIHLTWHQGGDLSQISGWDVLRATTPLTATAAPDDKEFRSLLEPGEIIPCLGQADGHFYDLTAEPQAVATAEQFKYWYQVVAVKHLEERSTPATSGAILPPSGTFDLPAPGSVMAGFAGNFNGVRRVGLKWSYLPTSNLLGFDIYRSDSPSFPLNASTLIGSSADLRYTDDIPAGVGPNSGPLYYVIRAVVEDHTGGEVSSSPSVATSVAVSLDNSAVVAVPEAPNPLVVVEEAPDRVTLEWGDTSMRESEFRVFRRQLLPNTTGWSLVGRVTADSTGFTDGSVSAGRRYEYEVASINILNDNVADPTGPTREANTPAAGDPPNTPDLSKDEEFTTDNAVALIWEVPETPAAPAPTGYYVFRKDSVSSPYVLLTPEPLTTPWYDDYAVMRGKEYTYRVTAVSAAGSQSGLSNEVTHKTETYEVDVPPTLVITAPTAFDGIDVDFKRKLLDDDRISRPTPVKIIVDDVDTAAANWFLELRPEGAGSDSLASIPLTSGTTLVKSGRFDDDGVQVFTLDPSRYPSGDYLLTLYAEPTAGQRRARPAQVRVSLHSMARTGDLTLPATDIEVDVTGSAPLVVTRVYDSSRANELGDFGYGWFLQTAESAVRSTARPSHAGRTEGDTFRQGDVVYITLPTGQQHAFQFWPVPETYNPDPQAGGIDPYGTGYFGYTPQFVCVDGSNSVLIVEGDLHAEEKLHLEYDRVNDEFHAFRWLDDEGDPGGDAAYSPALFGGYYQVRTADGTLYDIDAASGRVRWAKDVHEVETNYVAYESGLVTSGGLKLEITRGGLGNVITRIEVLDEDTNQYVRRAQYTYDHDSVNLTDVEVDNGETHWDKTSYLYDLTADDRRHHLTKVLDDHRVATLTATYDPADGKVRSVIDAAGNEVPINFGTSDGSQTSQIVSEPGAPENSTEVIHDAYGNIVREIRAVTDASGVLTGYSVTVHEYRYNTGGVVADLSEIFDNDGPGVTNAGALSSQTEHVPFFVPVADAAQRYFRDPDTKLRETVFSSELSTDDQSAGRRMPLTTTEFVHNPDTPLVPDERITTYDNYVLGRPGTVTVELKRGSARTVLSSTRVVYDPQGNARFTFDALNQGTEFVYSHTERRAPAAGVEGEGLPAGLLLTTQRLGVLAAGVIDGIRGDDRSTWPAKPSWRPDAVNVYYTDDEAQPIDPSQTLIGSAYGRLKYSEDAAGVRTWFIYDPAGQLIHSARLWVNPHPVAGPEGQNRWVVATSVYDPMGRVKETREAAYLDDMDGVPDLRFEDEWNIVLAEAPYPEGATPLLTGRTTYEAGRVAATTDALDRETRRVYDARGNLIETEHPDGTVVRTAYDHMGRAAWTSDRYHPGTDNGRAPAATRTLFDSLGRSVGSERYRNVEIHLVPDPLVPNATAPGGVKTAVSPRVIARDVAHTHALVAWDTGAGAPYAGSWADVTVRVGLNGAIPQARPFNVSAKTITLSSTDAGSDSITIDAEGFPANVEFLTVELVTARLSSTATHYDGAGRVVETRDAAGARSGTLYHPDGSVSASGLVIYRLSAAGAPDEPSLPFGPAREEAGKTAYLVNYTTRAYGRLDTPVQGQPHPLDGRLYDSTTDARGLTSKTPRDLLGRADLTVWRPDTPAAGEPAETSARTYYGLVNAKASGPFSLPEDPLTTESPDTDTDFDAIFVSRRNAGVVTHVVEVDQEGHATHRLFDQAGHLTDVWLPGQYARWRYEYDLNGNLASQTDPRGFVTSFEYDEYGRRTVRTLAVGQASEGSETWRYDPHGRVRVHQDFMGHTTWHRYDAAGRVSHEYRYGFAIVPSESAVPEDPYVAGSETAYAEKTEYVYDDAGPLGPAWPRMGRVSEVREDVSVKSAAQPNADPQRRWTTRYGYDPITGGVTSTETYEGTYEAWPSTLVGTISREYDPASGRLVRTYTTHNDTRYAYDDRGRLSTATAHEINGVPQTGANAPPKVTSYEYDVLIPAAGGVPAHYVDRVTLPGGVKTETRRDDFGRPDIVRTYNAAGDLFTQDFEHYADGQKKHVVEKRYSTPTTFSETKISWTYYPDGRLWTETRDEGNDGLGADQLPDPGDYKHTYAYDKSGNRLSKEVDAGNNGDVQDVITSTYDARDRLLTVNHTDPLVPDETYGYDANGSTIWVTSTAPAAGTKRYVWDLRERLAGYNANGNTHNGQPTGTDVMTDVGDWTYASDTNGVRVKATEVTVGGNVHTYFLQDTANPTGYSQVIEESSTADPADIPTRSYVIGADVIAQATPAAGTQYLMYDAGGSTRGLLNTDGAVIDANGTSAGTGLDYDAFGNPIGFTIQGASTFLLYRGEYLDRPTGMYQLRARYYQPSIGMFSSFDSYEGDTSAPLTLHKYAYTASDPINLIDPTGNFFDIISLISSMANRGLGQGSNIATVKPVLTAARALNMATKFYNGVAEAWDILSTIADFTNLADLTGAEQAAFRAGLTQLGKLGVHMSSPTITIPVPKSLVNKLKRRVGPLWGTPPMQALMGAATAALVTTMLGWETTDISASYTGVDAIMKVPSLGVYAVVEAKGGSSKLGSSQAGRQMYDSWIKKRVQKALDENLNVADHVALDRQKNGPLLAAVFSTDLTGAKPELAFKVQTYPNIKSWGAPFE